VPAALTALRSGAFRSVAAAYALGQVLDWVVEIALAIAVYERTGSALAAALVFVALRVVPVAALPWACGRPLGGLAALRVAAVAALALGVDGLPIWALLALGLADGAGSLGGRAGSRAATARLFERDDDVRAGNAVLNVAFAVAAALAPAAAGALVAFRGVGAALIAGAVLAAVACAVASRVRVSERRDRALRPGGALRALRAGGGALLVAAEALLLVLFTAAVPAELPYAIESLGAGDAGYGLLLTAWGAGTVAGSVAFAALGRLRLPVLAGVATAAVALAYALMGVAPTLAIACAGAAVGGAGNGIQWVAVATWVQRVAPRDAEAQVAALLESVAVLAPGAGFLLGGALVTVLSPRACFLAMAVAIPLVAAAAMTVWAWKASASPAAPDGAASPAANPG
jgi:hypothetical protein